MVLESLVGFCCWLEKEGPCQTNKVALLTGVTLKFKACEIQGVLLPAVNTGKGLIVTGWVVKVTQGPVVTTRVYTPLAGTVTLEITGL